MPQTRLDEAQLHGMVTVDVVFDVVGVMTCVLLLVVCTVVG
jgi:hypothetical protein